MSQTPIQRAAFLRSELDRHNRLYYVDAKPEISDRDFDVMLEELKNNMTSNLINLGFQQITHLYIN